MAPVVIGNATLYHGKCESVLPLLTQQIDVVVTDPPYGLYRRLRGGSWGATTDNLEVLEWDRVPPDEMVAALVAKFPDCVIWGGNYFALPPSRGWLVWHKPNAVPSAADFELAWTSRDANGRLLSLPISRWGRAGHPTEKPVPLMAWTLEKLGITGTILDPYMGSGSTGIAAIQRGCSFIGIESESKYFDMACRRFEQAAADGQLFAPEPVKPGQSVLFEQADVLRQPARARRKAA